jgi:hypothetical protein
MIFKLVNEPFRNDVVEEFLPTQDFPEAIFEYDGKHALVLWQNAPIRTLIRVPMNGSGLRHFPKA